MNGTASIEREIASARTALGRQLSEAENKAREAIDWRTHYRRNPAPLLAAAAAVGFVASAMLDGRGDGNAQSRPAMPALALSSASVHGAVDKFMNALVATASIKAAEYIEQWIPGFHQQFDRR